MKHVLQGSAWGRFDLVTGAPWQLSAAIRVASGILLGFYVATYAAPAANPAPEHVRPSGLALAAVLVSGGLFQWLLRERAYVRMLMFAIDTLTPVAFVWLYVFDPTPNVFALVFVGVAQGALAFGNVGGLVAWAIISFGYVASEALAEPFSGVAALPALVALRVVAALFIALLVGRVAERMVQAGAARGRAEEELAMTEGSLRALFDASPVALVLVKPDGVVEAWSPAAERLFGWSAREAVGRYLPFVGRDKVEESSVLRERLLSGVALVEADVLRQRKDGSPVEVDLSLAPIHGPDGSVSRIVAAISECTERKLHEREIQRLNRALRTLSLCNQAMLRIWDEQELLETICRTLVVHGGFGAAWVGFAERDEALSMRPIAHAGDAEGFPDPSQTWSDTDGSGRGPMGTAIRTGLPQFVDDIATDPRTTAWRAEAAARGFASLAALPLHDEGTTFGVLTLCSDGHEAFDQAERGLLLELADDLAFGITTIRAREEKQRILDELLEAENKYRALVDRIPAVVYTAELGINGRWLYVGPHVEDMLGLRPDEVLEDPQLLFKHVHPDDREMVLAAEEARRSAGERFSLEYRVNRPDGRTIWIQDEAEIVYDDVVREPRMFGLIFDVTERRLADEELRETLELLRRMAQQRSVLNARLVNAEERERARIASDIHDDAIQAITAVSLRLNVMREQIEEPELRETLGRLEEAVTSAIGRLRTLIFELRPRMLDQEGLARTLAYYLEKVFGPTEIEWTLDERLDREPDPDIRNTMYRIAGEALSNARKHSRARHVSVVLEPLDDGFHTVVRDDGSGFSPAVEATPEPEHLGLFTMRERAELAGGWLRIDTAPGRGTTVESWIPATPA